MSTAMATRDDTWGVMEKVVMQGDLKSLTPQERVTYVRQLTESLGMNHLTQPFQYMTLQGKLTLYATKNAAEQLRKINGISIERVEKEIVNDTYVVTVSGRDAAGRTDSDMGAVSIKGLSGDALVNAMLKAITKAKRRFTLSICGLGFLDETEVETIRGATPVAVDADGVVIEPEGMRLPLGLTPEQWARLHSMATAAGVDLDPRMTADEIAGAIRRAGGPPIPGPITPRAVKEALDRVPRPSVDGEAQGEEDAAAASKTDEELRAEIAQGSLIGTGR